MVRQADIDIETLAIEPYELVHQFAKTGMLFRRLLAGAAIRGGGRTFKDEVPDIQAELALNAKIRELQGLTRVGDELTERYKSVEHVGRVREKRQ